MNTTPVRRIEIEQHLAAGLATADIKHLAYRPINAPRPQPETVGGIPIE